MSEEIQQGFIRQRRNLIIISLVLFFAEFTDLTITKLNFLGNELILNQPINADQFLWIVWGYFLIRYYQYLHDIGDLGYRSIYYDKINRLIPVLANRKMNRDPKIFEHLKAEGMRNFSFGKSGSGRPAVIKQNLFDVVVRGKITSHSKNDNKITHYTNDVNINLGWENLWWAYLKSAFVTAINTRFILEYFFPFIVASLPIFSYLSTV